MKIKPSPFNILFLFLLGITVYSTINSGPMGFGVIALFYIFPVAIVVLLVDYLWQKFSKKYIPIIVIQSLLILIFLVFFQYSEREKKLIVSDLNNTEYVYFIYGVSRAEKLPVNAFKWTYTITIPKNGIVLTSSSLKSDIPKAKFYAKNGSVEPSDELCFGKIKSGEIIKDSVNNKYEVWKKCSNGAITSTSNEIKQLELNLINKTDLY